MKKSAPALTGSLDLGGAGVRALKRIFGGLAVCAAMLPLLSEAEAGNWDERLARSISPRLLAIETELKGLAAELPGLPGVTTADQGGTGGFANRYDTAEPPKDDGFSVSLGFAAPGEVDLVVLVPARRYGTGGLEPQYGLPDAFTVDLYDEKGESVARIASLANVWADPVRAGHPFVFPVQPPVRAAGMKISASRLGLDSEVGENRYTQAWAEAFAFAGERNLARGGSVRLAGGFPPTSSWQWSVAYLIDGQTPLGLPEIPAGPHQNVGWMSDPRMHATDPVGLELDLGKVCDFDAIRLFPAKRPTSDLPSGFGFPKRVTITVPAEAAGETAQVREFSCSNPGHNPVVIPLGNWSGRRVSIRMTELWKAFENYPAFAALSEVEVLHGEENLALGAGISAKGGGSGSPIIGSGAQWTPQSLTDGFGPEGKLVSERAWLLALGRRLELEERQYRLRHEADGIVASWRRVALATVTIFGVLGLVILVAFPIRYRLREKRQLAKARDRIAGDLHDEVGSNLGSIQMFADLAERRQGASAELKRIQRIAAETVSAVRDIVWLLRPEGNHRIATVEHLRETCSIMLEPLEWKFSANEAAWQCEISDESNRHLFLFLRESLHNVLRHSEAKHVEIHVECDPKEFHLKIADDGSGIPPEKLERPSTLRALRKRAESLHAHFTVDSKPGQGTRLELVIPLQQKRRGKSPAAPRPQA